MKNEDDSPQRVALYFRVSTDEQAKSGYSIPDQRRTLRERATSEGWEVVEEIADDGYSGATLDRPGIWRIYELAEAGEIDLVLATKRDRFFRNRLYRLEMDRDLKDQGVTLVSLTDTGNLIGDSVMDSFAEYEHQVIRDRTASGKIQKARAGKVVGGHTRAYGFDWTKDHDGKTVGYAVNEPEMNVVRRIFSLVASGDGIRTVKGRLDDEKVQTPGRGKTWSRPFLKAMILDDLYKPHTVEKLKTLGVSDDVASRLDAGGTYGVYRYQGIPVPIPNAGIPYEVVMEARRRVESHDRPPERNTSRPWELRSILYCEECGRRMQTHSSDAKRGYTYYRCQTLESGRHDPCEMRVKVRADSIEPKVWGLVRGILDEKHALLKQLERHFEQRRRQLRRPGADEGSLLKQLDDLEKRWAKVQEAYEAGLYTLADTKARRVVLDAERDAIERELERTRSRDEELRKLDAEEEETRQRIEAGYGDLSDTTPEQRRQVYEDVGLRVEVGLEKVPRISGIFPVGRFGDEELTLALGKHDSGRQTAYVISSEVGREKTSSRRGGPSRRG